MGKGEAPFPPSLGLCIPFQRRDFRVLAKALPPKQEYVLKVRLSEVQDNLYVRYLKHKEIKCYVATDLFSTYAALAKVCGRNSGFMLLLCLVASLSPSKCSTSLNGGVHT